MLTIRMQRTGRKGHAMFRVVVQDSRVTPTSGKVVALLGNYDPHAKTVVLDKDKATAFLKNGAQPSDRAALLLKKEGVKLPEWVNVDTKKAGKLRNAEKLRKNQPKDAAPKATEEPAAQQEVVPVETERPAEEVAVETPEPEAVTEAASEEPTTEPEASTEEPVAETETPTEEPTPKADAKDKA